MNSSEDNHQPSIEQLTEQFNSLKSSRDTLAGQIQQLEESLEGIKEEAREAFGTDEVEKLEELMVQQQAKNKVLSEEYQAHLEKLKGELDQVQAAIGRENADADSEEEDD